MSVNDTYKSREVAAASFFDFFTGAFGKFRTIVEHLRELVDSGRVEEFVAFLERLVDLFGFAAGPSAAASRTLTAAVVLKEQENAKLFGFDLGSILDFLRWLRDSGFDFSQLKELIELLVAIFGNSNGG